MSEELTLDMFQAQLNSKFGMHYDESNAAEIELIRATDLSPNVRLIQFSVEFLAPVDAPLTQKIYKLRHPQMGEIDLFLVPIGKDNAGVRYEAVFNRQSPKGD